MGGLLSVDIISNRGKPVKFSDVVVYGKRRRSQLRRVRLSLCGGRLCCRRAALAGFGQDLLHPCRVLVDILNKIVVDLHHGVFIFDRGNDNRLPLLSYGDMV